MTVIGKILTFLVFFLSLVFLGFAFSINKLNKDTKTGLSWKAVAEKARFERDALQEDMKLLRDENITRLQARVNELSKELTQRVADLSREVKQANDLESQAKAKAAQSLTAFENSQNAARAAVTELEVRRKEAIDLHGKLKDLNNVISDMQANATKLTNEKVQFQVAANTFMDRARNLEKQVQDLTKQLETERVAQADKDLTTPGRLLVPRPPPDDVKGLVKSVGQDGLVSITIGSDAGLLRGHTLEVFRTEPKSEYLGRMQIIDVSAHEAVGRMLTPKFSKLVKPNDTVASSITGSVRAGK